MQNTKILAQKELATRILEKRNEKERNDLYEYYKNFMIEEKRVNFVDSWHYKVICDKLMQVFNGEITRLVINVPPRTWKTELVTKVFPSWVLGKIASHKFIATWYSAKLTQSFSNQARDILKSEYFKKVFPRFPGLSDTKDTQDWWETKEWGQYYATGAGWTITWMWADTILIDDPTKPQAVEWVELEKINRWFSDTLESRLNNQNTWSIVIIMQRLHDNDLVWYLTELESEWIWDEWEKVIIPAISETEEVYYTDYGVVKRPANNLLLPEILNREKLQLLRKKDPQTFSSQYQQQPINKDTQEFHEEWFRYFTDVPLENGRIFTTIDPAFSKKKSADDSVITTAKFIDDKLYILEQTWGKWDPAELEDKIIYHIKKWNPEKVWVEAFAAQTTIAFSLQRRLKKEGLMRIEVVEIKQTQDKLSKIRSLISWYKHWLIYHNKNNCDKLETQLVRFPKWKNDDYPDSLQMIYYLHEANPKAKLEYQNFKIEYDGFGFVK